MFYFFVSLCDNMLCYSMFLLVRRVLGGCVSAFALFKKLSVKIRLIRQIRVLLDCNTILQFLSSVR